MAKKKKNATRRLLIIIGGIVILLVILGVVAKATGLVGQQEQATNVETATVEVRDLTQVVTASGQVQPEIEVKISPDVSGEIIDLRIKEGDQVAKGDLLARIRADFYVAQVEQAEAGVLQSKASMAQRRADMLTADLELKRQKDLFDKQAISESAYQQADNQYQVTKAAFEAAEYAVQSAEARLREARETLSKTSIYAPMDGTVSKLDVELGERVVGTTQFAGTEMLRIAKLDQMELEVDVNENDVVNVAIGDTASIEIDAYPDQTFKGMVTEIANSARITGAGTQEQVTNFPVKIRIMDRHNMGHGNGGSGSAIAVNEVPIETIDTPQFRPGMSGTVDVFTKTVMSAVAVPIQAVTVRDFNQLEDDDADADSTDNEVKLDVNDPGFTEDLRKVVFIVEEDKANMIEIETGISDDTHIEVKTGLHGGEKIIIGPYRAVSRTLEPDDAVQENKDRRGPRGSDDATE